MSEQQYGEHGRCEATAQSTGERCQKAAIGPHGKCDVHGGKSKKGTEHPNFKHGKTSKYFKSKLSERQEEVYDEIADALDEPEDAKLVLSQVATQMILRGEHNADPALVREGRQLLSEFNIVDNTDQIEMQADVDQTTEHELGADEKELALEVIRQRQEQASGGGGSDTGGDN